MKFIDKWLIFGERSLTLIGAVFPDFESARLAKKMLERESAGIWRTALAMQRLSGAGAGAEPLRSF